MANFKVNKPYAVSWLGINPNKPIDKSKPFPPINVFVTNPYIIGTLDIRWDHPLKIPENSQWAIQGINIYRSTDSEVGPYIKINDHPIEPLSYRDKTSHIFVSNEDILPRLCRGTNSKGDWVFTTTHKPIVKQVSQNIMADNSNDIVLRIDNGDGQGLQIIPAFKVFGRSGEVYLINKPVFNPITRLNEPPRLPEGPNAKCYCSYWYNGNFIKSDVYPRYFYKLTTVGKDKLGNTLESSLDDVQVSHVHQLEKVDYFWRAIINKNRYLLEQMGERAKLFIRKEVGQTCPHYNETHAQAHYTCPICFGTNIVGGFEGPYDILMSPPEAEKRIEMTNIGLRLNFNFESWTGPSPLIRTGDLIVRQNGERMVVGSLTPQGPKGAVFQQHFSLNYRDIGDIIYQLPIHEGEIRIPVKDDTRHVNAPVTDASPQIPEHKSERAETEKGRSIQFENVTW